MRTFILAILLLLGVSASAQTLSEDQKISALLTYVEHLDNAVFIRNGKEYDNKQAAKLMSEKLKRKRDKVKTAKDFISECASYSSSTGKPYEVKLDGKQMTTQELLVKELVRMETCKSPK